MLDTPQNTPAPTQVPNQQDVPTGLPQPGTVPPARTPAPAPAPTPATAVTPPPTQHLQNKPAAQGSVQRVSDLAPDLAKDPNVSPMVDYIQTVCGDRVDLGRAFQKAVENGDTSLIDSAYLNEVLGPQEAANVIRMATNAFDYAAAQHEAQLQIVYQAAGGEAVLRQAVTYWEGNATADDKAEINALLDSGNKALMERAARKIVDFAKAKGGVVVNAQQPLGSPTAVQGITSEEYKKALANPRLSENEYNALRQQRVLGKRQGLN